MNHNPTFMKRTYATVFYACLLALVLVACAPANIEIDVAESFSYEGPQVTRITVKGSFGNINVTEDPGTMVTFEGIIKGKSSKEGYAFEHTLSTDGHLEITMITPNNANTRNLQATMDLTVSPGIALNAQNSSGNVVVEDFFGSRYDINVSSGNITLRRIGALEVTLKASSGNIRLEEVQGVETTFDITATSGNINLQDLEGRVDVLATSGNISANNVGGNLSIQNTSGNISFNGGQGTFDAEANSGAINLDNFTLMGSSNFRVSSGSINLDLNNPETDLAFDLSANSGSVRVGGQSQGKSFQGGSGPVSVNARASSGNITVSF